MANVANASCRVYCGSSSTFISSLSTGENGLSCDGGMQAAEEGQLSQHMPLRVVIGVYGGLAEALAVYNKQDWREQLVHSLQITGCQLDCLANRGHKGKQTQPGKHTWR